MTEMASDQINNVLLLSGMDVMRVRLSECITCFALLIFVMVVFIFGSIIFTVTNRCLYAFDDGQIIHIQIVCLFAHNFVHALTHIHIVLYFGKSIEMLFCCAAMLLSPVMPPPPPLSLPLLLLLSPELYRIYCRTCDRVSNATFHNYTSHIYLSGG